MKYDKPLVKIKAYLLVLLNKEIDLPPLKVWHYVVIIAGILLLGVCSVSDGKIKLSEEQRIKNINTRLFYTKGYEWILKAECGHFKPPCCHKAKYDPGNFTCNGLAIKYNQEVIAECLTKGYNLTESLRGGLRGNPDGSMGFTLCERLFKDVYYEKYYKRFEKCPFKIGLQIADSYINSGQGVRLFQRSQGLKADNIWGPETEKACKSNPDMKKFKEARKNRYKNLKTCHIWVKDKKTGKKKDVGNCRGWFNRLDNLEEYIKKL